MHLIYYLAFYGGLEINIQVDDILVYTDTYTNDMFDIIVDLGSALGLWLGLTALSIFDYVIEACLWKSTIIKLSRNIC